MGPRVIRVGHGPFGPPSAAFQHAMEGRLKVARPRPRELSELQGEAGPAWLDAAFADELRTRDRSIDAPAAAREALEAMARGEADCVVAGQQPGLLGGPILLASKLACAIALARHLSQVQQRPVHPVYWCGSDDSDFEETTRAWMWSLHGEPFRARLELAGHVEGTRVGSIAGDAIGRLERDALEHADSARASHWNWERSLQRLERGGDFAERAAIWAHELFPDAGLIVVDARSPRLRALGSPLLQRYQSTHERCTQRLFAHAESLRREGLPAQLSEEALRSGLFVLDEERRSKLEPERIAAADPDTLAPSVLLRPLWQDQLLGPRAAVLGPAELAYHAQLAPLYEELQVRASAALPRAMLHCLPEAMVERVPEDLDALVAGERVRSDWLAEHALLERDRTALRALEEDLAAATARLAETAPSAEASMIEETRQRLSAQVQKLRQQMLPAALRERGEAWRMIEAWSGLRGVPQERCYALAALLLRFGGEDCSRALDALGEAWIEALDGGEMPTFAALLGGCPS